MEEISQTQTGGNNTGAAAATTQPTGAGSNAVSGAPNGGGAQNAPAGTGAPDGTTSDFFGEIATSVLETKFGGDPNKLAASYANVERMAHERSRQIAELGKQLADHGLAIGSDGRVVKTGVMPGGMPEGFDPNGDPYMAAINDRIQKTLNQALNPLMQTINKMSESSIMQEQERFMESQAMEDTKILNTFATSQPEMAKAVEPTLAKFMNSPIYDALMQTNIPSGMRANAMLLMAIGAEHSKLSGINVNKAAAVKAGAMFAGSAGPGAGSAGPGAGSGDISAQIAALSQKYQETKDDTYLAQIIQLRRSMGA